LAESDYIYDIHPNYNLMRYQPASTALGCLRKRLVCEQCFDFSKSARYFANMNRSAELARNLGCRE